MANGHGGHRPGAGRPKGSLNKLDSAARAWAQESGLLPLEYLLGVMRDDGQPQDIRMDAAKAAAPYVHARLQAMQLSGEDGGDIKVLHRLERVIVDPKAK